jgi:AGCS family alanine or glycine:cation symporter
VYLAFIVVAAIVTLQTAISIIDGAFAMMAIPTMLSALLLAPKVRRAATDYFAKLRR